MHSHNFFHNDLNVRNVLVRETDGMEVFVFDSPNGRRWIFPFREFRLIKDLSHLDKVACRVLRRTQRLRFYLAYRGTTRLTRADKRRLQRIVRRSALPLGQELKDRKNFIE